MVIAVWYKEEWGHDFSEKENCHSGLYFLDKQKKGKLSSSSYFGGERVGWLIAL